MARPKPKFSWIGGFLGCRGRTVRKGRFLLTDVDKKNIRALKRSHKLHHSEQRGSRFGYAHILGRIKLYRHEMWITPILKLDCSIMRYGRWVHKGKSKWMVSP